MKTFNLVKGFQYCGLYINRGHLVLLDALPGCMIHVTVDELLVEAFRSRERYVNDTRHIQPNYFTSLQLAIRSVMSISTWQSDAS